MSKSISVAARSGRRIQLLLALALIATVLLPLASPAQHVSAAGSAVTTAPLNMRTGPGTSFAVRLVMPQGVTVQLLRGPRNGFYKVTWSGTTGWASAAWLDLGGTTNDSSATASAVTTAALNLRARPARTAAVLLVMPSGASVTLTGASRNGYLGVIYKGTRGWAHADYLSTATNTDGSTGNGDGVWTEAEIIAIIYAAADRYGQPREDMLRVARCESLLDPYAYNPLSGVSGLFQFMPGTWATTPYAAYSIWDPWANANAAGWMWSVGRRNEWACQ